MKFLSKLLLLGIFLISNIPHTIFANPTAPQAYSSFPERANMTPSGWYWLTGVTPSQVSQKISQGYRVFDLEIESASPLKLGVSMVKNSGVHKSGLVVVLWQDCRSGEKLTQQEQSPHH